jgi:hypothetical protein
MDTCLVLTEIYGLILSVKRSKQWPMKQQIFGRFTLESWKLANLRQSNGLSDRLEAESGAKANRVYHAASYTAPSFCAQLGHQLFLHAFARLEALLEMLPGRETAARRFLHNSNSHCCGRICGK